MRLAGENTAAAEAARIVVEEKRMAPDAGTVHPVSGISHSAIDRDFFQRKSARLAVENDDLRTRVQMLANDLREADGRRSRSKICASDTSNTTWQDVLVSNAKSLI